RHENPVDFRNPVNPTDPLDGFEADAKPSPWLLVPQRGGNRLRLVNGGSFSLLTHNPPIAAVERGFSSVGGTFMGLIEVRGVGVGETAILVLDGVRNAVARLEVSVRERRRVTVALHFVKDPDWGTQTRKLGEAPAMLVALKQIFDQQAAIEIVPLPARAVLLGEKMRRGDAVICTDATGQNVTPGDEWPKVVKHRNAAATINVFFVRQLDDGFGFPSAQGLTVRLRPRDVLIGDNATDAAWTLAHECGHTLG